MFIGAMFRDVSYKYSMLVGEDTHQ